jgi:hypothetical protein
VIEKIVERKMIKFYEEVCLYDQPFVKDSAISIAQFMASTANKLGEKIGVRRFVRFKLGDREIVIAEDSDWRPEGDDEAGVTANKPKGAKAGGQFTAAKLDNSNLPTT